jgi:hypothetical protein
MGYSFVLVIAVFLFYRYVSPCYDELPSIIDL